MPRITLRFIRATRLLPQRRNHTRVKNTWRIEGPETDHELPLPITESSADSGFLIGDCRSKGDLRVNKKGDPKSAGGCMHGQCQAAAVFWDHPSIWETTEGIKTSAIAAETMYIFISPSHASACKLESPRKKIIIIPISHLYISVSVTTCCFDGSILGG